MRHERLEAIGVTEDPVDHVATEGGSRGTDAIAIDKRHRCQLVDPVHDVHVRLPAPIAGNLLDELLSVAGRASRIRHEDHVAARGEHLWIPAIGPRVRPVALWAAVNE